MRKKPTVEITIPVYNEEEQLEANIFTLARYCSKKLIQYDWKITIADNGSTDKTAHLSQELSKKKSQIRSVHLGQQGRGRAVKSVWGKAKADYYVYMDLDLSTDLKHLPRILHALEKGFDIAIGSRLKKGAKVEGRSMLREITSRALNFFFIQLFFFTHFTDAQCGFKAVNKRVVKELLPRIKDDGWFFDGELLIVGEKMGYKIHEEPVHWIDNPGSTVQLLSTISGDIKTMIRLLRTKPWKGDKK